MNAENINAARVEKIRQVLNDALAPQNIDVIDESHLHAGHAGAATGLGHFRVHVVAQAFESLTLIKRHRLVYEAVGDLMTSDIHALTIDAQTPAEAASG